MNSKLNWPKWFSWKFLRGFLSWHEVQKHTVRTTSHFEVFWKMSWQTTALFSEPNDIWVFCLTTSKDLFCKAMPRLSMRWDNLLVCHWNVNKFSGLTIFFGTNVGYKRQILLLTTKTRIDVYVVNGNVRVSCASNSGDDFELTE